MLAESIIHGPQCCSLSLSSGLVFRPSNPISAVGQNLSFLCSSPLNVVTRVEWFLNGTIYENMDLPDIEVDFSTSFGGIGVLMFLNSRLEYNETRVRCRLSYTGPGSPVLMSEVAVLRLQGTKLIFVLLCHAHDLSLYIISHYE